MALLTGNGDLHLENLSIIDRGEGPCFSPVYDPTPMRAYSIHNMLSVMPFGDYGEFTGHAVNPSDLPRPCIILHAIWVSARPCWAISSALHASVRVIITGASRG